MVEYTYTRREIYTLLKTCSLIKKDYYNIPSESVLRLGVLDIENAVKRSCKTLERRECKKVLDLILKGHTVNETAIKEGLCERAVYRKLNEAITILEETLNGGATL